MTVVPTEFSDRFSREQSIVHRIDARVKILLAGTLIVIIAATPFKWWPAYLAWAAIALGSFAAAQLPWSFLLKRLALAAPFLFLIAAGVPLSRGFNDGFDLAAGILTRGLLSLMVMITLAATTPLEKLLAALEQFRTPRILIWILAFMHRYLFVLADELTRMRRAKQARSFRASLWFEFQCLGNFVGVLFLRAFERGERVYAAMCARGWTGDLNPRPRPPRQPGRDAKREANPPDEVEVRNLTFHYPDGKMALHEVSFEVEAGECVALVGPNGAGKSTLLLHLNGVLPGRGEYEHHHFHGNGRVHHHGVETRVWIGGIPVGDRHQREVRRRVGLLFQDPNDQLFCPTVWEDVAFGPKNMGRDGEELREIVGRCLTNVGLPGFEDRLPHHLSFGERKRVCLAAVLACDPTMLALDEPTGNLDPAGRRQLITLLRDLPLTKIIATHDLDLVGELCDRVLVLEGGRLQAEGRARENLANQPPRLVCNEFTA